MATELLRAENLEKYFPVTEGLILTKTVAHVRAVDGISFTPTRGRLWAWLVNRGAARPPRPSCCCSWKSRLEGRYSWKAKASRLSAGRI